MMEYYTTKQGQITIHVDDSHRHNVEQKKPNGKEPTHWFYLYAGQKQDTESCQGNKMVIFEEVMAGENHEGLLAAEMFYILIWVVVTWVYAYSKIQQAKNLSFAACYCSLS